MENSKITKGSGNVFADLGFKNPHEHQLKADIAIQIIKIIKKRSMTQKQAAEKIGASQPDISKLKTGQVSGFSLERLFEFLTCLNRDIKIQIKATNKAKGVICAEAA